MADYKELLRRAISALPENNGAARRAVYEKARSALVGQLRAITPPLPARDITQHRLKLEDCIRQVEQEASEAIISLGRDNPLTPRSEAPAPRPVETPRAAVVEPVRPEQPRAELPPIVVTEKPAPANKPAAPSSSAPASISSIEDIISEAAATSGASVSLLEAEPKAPAKTAEPASVDRPSPVRPVEGGLTASRHAGSNVRSLEQPQKAPSFEPRRDAVSPLAANTSSLAPRVEPSLGNQALARQPATAPLILPDAPPVEAALSSVREVELEPDANESQDVIERAIETLDRAARGESVPSDTAPNAFSIPADDTSDDAGFVEPPTTRGGGGLTIFLVVFVILLAGVGGAGFWAWREGYVDLDQMFGQAQTAVVDATTQSQTTTPTLDPVQSEASGDADAVPGNTVPAPTPEDPGAAVGGLELDDRLEPTPEPVLPTGNETVLPSIGTGEVKSEDRLPGEDTAVIAANDPTASVDPAVLAGSQSLLLEASADGSTGAVPFSGTVEWTEGVDELGLPTLMGEASIPARNLSVDITIRKNSDPSLPASHLMEVDFNVSDTFIGGTIANLPGVLLKDQELVPGTALVGASARVVGNSFLFALSATPNDTATNTDLLENRRWMDLAVVYGTGRNAIITLEKDDDAQALFERVFTTWNQ